MIPRCLVEDVIEDHEGLADDGSRDVATGGQVELQLIVRVGVSQCIEVNEVIASSELKHGIVFLAVDPLGACGSAQILNCETVLKLYFDNLNHYIEFTN